MNRTSLRDRRRGVWIELRMIGSTILGLLAGRSVWLPPSSPSNPDWAEDVPDLNLSWAVSSYRERLKSETAGIEAVRKRAEFALTAIIAALGLSLSAAERVWSAAAVYEWLIPVWMLGIGLVVVAILVFAGVAVSKKVLGVVDVERTALQPNLERAELAEHVIAVHITSATRQALVTVFRDGVLVSLLGLTLVAAGQVFSLATSSAQPVSPATTNSVSPTPTN